MTVHRNKSSRTCPHPFAASLRRQWWVRGGGAPVVELLYKRWSPASRRPAKVSLLAFCLVDREDASALVEAWRVEQVQPSRDGSGRRQRICVQGHRGSGCILDRWASCGSFISSSVASVYCGSFQSFLAMGFRLAMGGWRSIPAADGESHRRRNLVHKGSRVFVVNVMFFRDLYVKCLDRILCIWP